MATVTKSIGVSGRDYSTITAWEADLDNTGIYASGDDAVGECYNDSIFTDVVIIDGGGTVGLNSIDLTVASTDRHDGTAGTGAVIGYSGGVAFTAAINGSCSWLEIDWGGTSASGNRDLISCHNNNYTYYFSNLLLHDASTSSSINGIYGRYGYVNATNNIVYNLTHTSAYTGRGILYASYRDCSVCNNTVYNIDATYPTPNINYGIQASNGGHTVKNNIALEIDTAVNFDGCFSTASSANVSHNLASDLTAFGVGALVNKSAADQFVSIVGGSEDLHLKTTADAVGAGEDLGSTPAGVQYDIDGVDRTLRDLAWDIGADQVSTIVVKTIGSAGRDYSTITAWEADLGDTNIYATGDEAVGECYDDSAFSESTITLNASRVTTLRPATGERHDGTVGTGVRIVTSSGNGNVFVTHNTGIIYTIDGIEFNSNTNGASYAAAVYIQGRTTLTGCIVHNMFGTGNADGRYGIVTTGVNAGHAINCLNNIVYDIGRDTGTGGSACVGISQSVNSLTGKTINIHNNTIYDIYTAGFYAYGIGGNIGSEVYLKNNLVADLNVSGTGSGSSVVAYPSFSDTTNVSNNASYDTTAPGSNAVTNASAANQFVSTVSGSEDLHLKTGADAIGAGVDLGSSPAGIQYDIDGYDRDAGDRVWDIGADQAIGSVVKTIGTAGRDYSTIATWEAGLSTILYQTGDEAVGECYNDSIFSEGVVINNGSQAYGTGTELSHIKLSAPPAERHDGTFGTGVTISYATYGSRAIWVQLDYTTIEWLCVIASGGTSYAPYTGIQVTSAANFGVVTGYANIRNNIVKSGGGTWANNGGSGGMVLQGPDTNCYNNIVYDWEFPSYAGISNYYHNQNVYNNTIYNCNTGIRSAGIGNMTSKNNISVGNSLQDYNGSSGTYTSSNNLSSDGTADDYGGTDHVVDVVTANQFVSTVSGSEDFHLLSTSDAVGVGVDLGTTPDGVQYDIDGFDRDAGDRVWDIGADQAVATVVKTIGTSSRDYSTIVAWEAALDDPIYQTGDDAVGECYDDSDFSGIITIDGGSSLSSKTLRPAVNEGHDGTSGTGVEILNGTISVDTNEVYVNQIEINTSTYNTFVPHLRTSGNATGVGLVATRMLVHGNGVSNAVAAVGESTRRLELYNSIVYDCDAVGVSLNIFGRYARVENVTIYGCDSAGLSATDDADLNLRNIISTGNTGDDFNNTYSLGTVNNNLSSDSTASGTGSLVNKSATNQFISIVAGAEDLHLKSGSDAIGSGADLGTSIEGVQYDIDGVDRDARGLTWDIGADQAPGIVAKSIGTSSRDYSTIQAWEADLDDAGLYQSGDDSVGECYNDSTFTQTDNLIIRSGGVVGLNSVTLTAAATDRHDGTAGTGAEIGVAYMKRIYMQAGYNASVSIKNVVSWLDINGQGYPRTGLFVTYTVNDELKNCICRSVGDGVLPPGNCYNNIIYTGGSFIYNGNWGTVYAGNILNNTVYGVNRGITVGIANSNVSIKNNICAGTSIVDFDGNFGDIGYGVPQVSNNLSSDATAPGTDSLINKSASNQFVSIIGGSEDLHLASGSDAIAAGVDLGSNLNGMQYDIDGVDRDARGTAWDIGADQAVGTVTKSIGSASRDYSTITAWEAALDNASIYQSEDDAVGECYNDSVFDEDISLDGGHTVGLTSITLTVAATERHDGTAGSGARIVYSGTSTGNIVNLGLGGNARPFKLFWLEVDNNANTNPYFCIDQVGRSVEIANCIVHGINKSSSSSVGGIWFDGSSSGSESVRNNLIYDCQKTGSTTGGSAMGILLQGNSFNYQALNNTVYNIASTHDSYGIYMFRDNHVSKVVKNCIAIDTSAGSVVYDFYPSTITTNSVEYNLSSDSTAFGTGSLTGKTAANQFVSTVSGSEDLHLKSGADAIGAGVDLATSSLDINGSDRNALAATVWDIGAHQFASTASIGSTGRDYSTITLWEADLDDTTIYGAGANAVGECYNDSNFSEQATINGGGTSTTGLNSITLTVATSERHDGTAGTGAKMVNSSALSMYSDVNINISWFEIDQAGTNYGSTFSIVYAHNNAYYQKISNMLIHDPTSRSSIYPIHIKYGYPTITNNIVYNVTHTGPYRGYGINTSTYRESHVYNNTIYNIQGTHASSAYNFGINVSYSYNIKNNIALKVSDAIYSGCFGQTSTSNTSNNMSSDSTAPGTNSLINKSAAKQFVSTVSGSEDLHLKFISAAIDAGVDLGTTPDGVQYDIDGKDRDAENSIWDIGAHEFGDNVVYGLFTV